MDMIHDKEAGPMKKEDGEKDLEKSDATSTDIGESQTSVVMNTNVLR